MSTDINPYNAGPSPLPAVSGQAPPAYPASVDYELTPEDLIAFSFHMHATSPALRRQRRFAFRLMPLALVALGLLWLIRPGDLSGVLMAFLFLPAGVVLYVLGPWLQRRVLRRLLARVYAEGSNRTVLGWRRLSISPAGLSMVSELTETKMKWPAIEKIEASGKHAFIYTGSADAQVVPSRAFSDDAHFQTFVAAARQLWQRATDGA